MRSVYLAVLPLFLTTPVCAQDMSLPLIAKLLGGLVDGGEMLQGSLGKGRVAAIGEGAFEVVFESGVANFLYGQPDTCIFTQHSHMGDMGSASEVRFDFTKVTGVEVRAQGEFEGLTAALITFGGPEDMLQVMVGDGFLNQVPAFAFLATSMPLAELQAAAEELERIC